MIRTKTAMLVMLATAACGPSAATTGNTTPDPDPAMKPAPPPKDNRTPLEQRRDTACVALGPKITQCALEDSKTAAQNGEITQKQLSEISVPEVLKKNTEEFVTKCEAPMSSRQVRVLEVCGKSETECAPLLACLAHLSDPAK